MMQATMNAIPLNSNTMASNQFRYQLRQEATQWRDEGLISPELYRQLGDRYQFEHLDRATRNQFVMILLGLGSILIGLAAITLVAANWQAWSRPVKIMLLMGVFIGVNSGGFYLWRGAAQRWQSRLGQALLLLGGLLVGANLALFSQMFHQTGSVQTLFLVWGGAVVVMAYSLRLTMLGMLSMILAALGSFWFYPDPQTPRFWLLLLDYFPLVAIALYLPLAQWCQSRSLFTLATIFAAAMFQLILFRDLAQVAGTNSIGLVVLQIASVCLIPALLWAWRPMTVARVGALGPKLAIAYVSLYSYIASFHHWWDGRDWSTATPTALELTAGSIQILLFGAIAIALWWQLGQRRGGPWRLTLTDSSFAGLLLILGGVLWSHHQFGPFAIIAPVLLNSLLLLIAIACIREALSQGAREGFWWGLSLLVLQILSRMVEYDTGLIAKALVFFLCGIGVILAGLWFERYVRTLKTSPES
jgi:uncharacterized membrane protein